MQKRWKKKPSSKKNLQKIIPMKKVGKPDDIANGIMFLLSDQSQYITGTELIIDGGLTAKPQYFSEKLRVKFVDALINSERLQYNYYL